MMPGFQEEGKLRSLINEIDFVVGSFLLNYVAVPYLPEQDEV